MVAILLNCLENADLTAPKRIFGKKVARKKTTFPLPFIYYIYKVYTVYKGMAYQRLRALVGSTGSGPGA